MKTLIKNETVIYRLSRFLFEVTSSSFLLTDTLMEHANSYLSYEFVKLFLKFQIYIKVRGTSNRTATGKRT